MYGPSLFRSPLVLSLSLVGLLGLGGCDMQTTAAVPGRLSREGEVLATVNGKKITDSMLKTVRSSLPASMLQQLEAQGGRDTLIESLVTSEIVYQESIQRGLHRQPEVQDQLALAERNALAEALFQRVVEERLTDERVQQYYEDHLVEFAKPQLKLSHIVVREAEKAAEIVEQAREGGDFAALAREHSLDKKSAAKGGELEWFKVSELAGPIKEALAEAEKGFVAGPFELGPAQHVFKVLDRRDSQPLEDVREDIESRLESEIRDEYMKELRDQAVVVESQAEEAASPPAGAPAGAPEAPASPPAGTVPEPPAPEATE